MFTCFFYLNQFVGDNGELEHCIKHYFNEGLEYFEILQFLQRYHHTTISKCTLLRRLKDYRLSRRNNLNISNNVIRETRDRIVSIVDGSGSSSGYRSVWHSLQIAGFCAPRNLVQRLLKDIDPEGIVEYAVRSLRLENPSNYQQGLEVFLMLKHTALNGMQQH